MQDLVEISRGKIVKIPENATDIKFHGLTTLTIDTLLKEKSYSSSLLQFMLGSKVFVSMNEDLKAKKFVVSAHSDFPNMKFEAMEGTLVDPMKSKLFKEMYKPKRWSLSVFSGVGITLPELQFKPLIGIGVSYSLFQWNF